MFAEYLTFPFIINYLPVHINEAFTNMLKLMQGGNISPVAIRKTSKFRNRLVNHEDL